MKYLTLFLLFVYSTQTKAQLSDFNDYNFKKADSIAKSCRDENLKNLPLLAYKLTFKLPTQLEKFRAIYTWVSTNIDNDYNNYIKNKRKLRKYWNDSIKLNKWQIDFRKDVFKKLLKEQKTVCTGYAYIIQQLSFFSNIDCLIINGYGRLSGANVQVPAIPNHSWNAIKLNSKWYLCDATWSSGLTNAEENKFIKDYDDSYFLTTPELFALNHFPLDKKWMLLEKQCTLDDFLSKPLVYRNTFKHHVIPISPSSMTVEIKKNECITFKYSVKKPIKKENINLVFDNGAKLYTRTPQKLVIKNNTITLDYCFKARGIYDVHLKLKDDIVVSHSVKVKKNNN